MLPAFLFITMCMKWGSQNGGGVPPPSAPTPAIFSSWKYSEDSESLLNTTASITESDEIIDFYSLPGATDRSLAVKRGGSSSQEGGIVNGGKTVITRATTFWKSKFDAVVQSLQAKFQSKTPTKEQELMEKLQKMPIRKVVVPNSTVLPADVVRTASNRAGMIGSPLKMDKVQEFARQLKRWYTFKGYVLHSVTGANLDTSTGTAVITVEEPVVSALPVDIVFCKEMVVDPDTNDLLTFKEYRAKKQSQMERRSGFGRFQSVDLKIDKNDLNTTFVTTTGRTKPSKIARAMKLKPGTPFQWLDDRWGKISSSGVFSRILKASPQPTTDGGVCLQVLALEPPPRHLEYGVGKSVWTNSWEGEVDFDWRNIFGGGESVGVMVRRGTKDSSPSVRLRYGDDKFGLEGGYDIEAFTDFLGDTGSEAESKKKEETDSSTTDSPLLDEASLLNRRGATFRVRNPISPRIITNSVASASVERTSTTTGQIENIGSGSVTLGPFRRQLPMEAKSSVSTTLSGGARLAANGDGDMAGMSFAVSDLLPFSTASATTTQILPLTSSGDGSKKPITLALKHTVSTSTPNLPRHEAKAMGNSAIIRGAAPDGVASSVLKGTTELRLPVAAPKLGSGSVVLFGDWFCVQKDAKNPFYTKSSIGVGLRKNFQGIPLKFDVCYSSEGKVKQMFGMGADFDV